MYFRLHLNILIVLFLSLLFFSCHGDSENTGELVCNYGEKKVCTCDDGSDGKKICMDNAWQTCVCKTDELCENITCSGYGKCLVKSEKAVCICDSGYHADGLNCIKDGEVNPCDSKTCQDNSHCVVEAGAAKCICDNDYISGDDDICIYDCSGSDNSHVNESNDGCDCNDGYHTDNDKCVPDDDFKCLNYDCGDNAHCVVKNDNATCVCDDGFTRDNNICKLDCSLIEHSHPNTDNTECLCDNTYHSEENLCQPDRKMVPCTAITPPVNAHQIEENVFINWTSENGWEIPVNCNWVCDSGYQDKDENNTCEPACSDNSCEHATCDDSSGKIDCICDAGYQDKDNDEVCLPDCASTEIDGVACGGKGTCYDDTGVINCICEEGYQDNDHNGTCEVRCHIDILAPELSTCGEYGSCNDETGTVVCSCDDGYFVNPNTGKCEAPCDNIDCGKHGQCVALGLNNISCSCDDGYQDYDGDLICRKSCDSSCLTNSNACDDSTGELICQCDDNYQDNDRDGTCFPDCSGVTCDGAGQILNSCSDSSGFAVCSYESGYNYTDLISGVNEEVVNDSVVDSNGNLYLAGSFKGDVDFNPSDGVDIKSSSGDEDIFITRINADGSYGWTYNIGSYSIDGAQRISVDEYDNLYIAGYFSSTVDFDPSSSNSSMRSDGYRDIFILKITKYGEFVWSKSIMSNETEMVTSIKLDNSSVYLTGYLQGDNNTVVNVDFDKTSDAGNFEVKGRRDGFIARFNITDGSYVWAKVFGVAGMINGAEDILVLDNNIIVTGFVFGDNIDFDESDDNRGVISTNNKSETFILKLSKENQFVWVKLLESQTSADVSKGVKLEKINNKVYLLGNLTGNIDFDTGSEEDIVNAGLYSGIYIAGIDDNDGSILEKEIFMATDSASRLKDCFVYNNKLYIVGDISGSLNIQGTNITNSSGNTNKNDVFFTVLDSDLIVNSVSIFGGNLDDRVNAVSVSNNGEIYISGYFEGTSDFDPGENVNNKTSEGMKDIFISRFTD